jgi:hypothetical protein
VAVLRAQTALDALVRVDPVFCPTEPDSIRGTYSLALMAAGAQGLIDHISHSKTSNRYYMKVYRKSCAIARMEAVSKSALYLPIFKVSVPFSNL